MTELMKSAAYCLYVRRVLREVKRHSEDAYIDRNIKNEIAERILALTDGNTDEASVKAAIKQMEPAHELGLQYRKFYKFSAERPDGFLLFERFFTNIAGMAILLITALCVFRMFPQVEYVAYAICALAGVGAAFFAHRAFYNIHFALATLYIPAFLLIYYPCKDSISVATSVEGGFSVFAEHLFSNRYREIFLTLLAMILAYSVTTAFLHACAYLRKQGRIIAATLAFVVAGGALGGFIGYAYNLSDRYNAEADTLLSAVRTSYTNYQNGASADAAIAAALAQSELYTAYAGIYLPSTEQYGGSYAQLLEEFTYYDANVDDMIRRHHPAYDPTKRSNPFAYDTLTQKIATLKESVALLIHTDAPKGEPFRLLLLIEERSDMLYADLIATLKSCYNDWIYQE